MGTLWQMDTLEWGKEKTRKNFAGSLIASIEDVAGQFKGLHHTTTYIIPEIPKKDWNIAPLKGHPVLLCLCIPREGTSEVLGAVWGDHAQRPTTQCEKIKIFLSPHFVGFVAHIAAIFHMHAGYPADTSRSRTRQ